MIDRSTKYLGLPLPHEQNELQEDCQRIIQSFRKLDDFCGLLDAAWAARLSEFSAQLVRMSARVAMLEANGGGGSGLPQEGYQVEGAQIAPVTLVDEGKDVVPGAAIAFIVGDSETSENK